MRVDVYYDDGRIEQYNDERFTEACPFAKPSFSVMTRFTLRSGGDGLWLSIDYYDGSSRVKVDGHDALASLPRAGYEVQILTREDLDGVAWVSVDGMRALYRVGGSLVNAVKFEALSSLYVNPAESLGIAAKACALYDAIAAQMRAQGSQLEGEELVAAAAERMGWDAAALAAELAARDARIDDDGEEDGLDWE